MADEPLSIPLVFTDRDRAAVQFANHFLIQQQGDDEHILTVGQAAVPPMMAFGPDVAEELKRIGYVEVLIQGRFVLTRGKLRELVDALTRHLAQSDERDRSK